MQRTALSTEALCFPDSFAPFLEGARVFDSSSSPEARVFYLEKDGGYFLKKAKAGTLGTEAAMNTFFFQNLENMVCHTVVNNTFSHNGSFF